MAGPTHVGYVIDEPSGSYVEQFIKPDLNGVVPTTDHIYTEKFAYTGDMVEYHGWAIPGTATTGSTWKIRKLAYSGTKLTDIKYADGDANFDNAWDARESQSYS